MEKPPFWKVRLDELADVLGSVSTGTLSTLCYSPGGHPVQAVSYGPPAAGGTSNWSGAMGAGNAAAYRVDESVRQSVVLVGTCHGAESEATATLANFLRIMETGKDYADCDRSSLQELAGRYRVVVIPCLNPDGRKRSPDHMIGLTDDEARRINQGVWSDGSTIGYPACKNYQPLDPAKCESLGGYPNDDGYNIMHDATPGDIRTAEARGLLKLVADEAADLVLHMHSHALPPAILPANHGMYDLHRKRILSYRKRMAEVFQRKGLDVLVPPDPDPAATWLCPVNLATMTALASGALSPVFEQPNGTGPQPLDFATMLEHGLAAIETFLEWGLKERFSPRAETMYSIFDCDVPPAVYLQEKWT